MCIHEHKTIELDTEDLATLQILGYTSIFFNCKKFESQSPTYMLPWVDEKFCERALSGQEFSGKDQREIGVRTSLSLDS